MTDWHAELVAAHCGRNTPIPSGAGWMPSSNDKRRPRKTKRKAILGPAPVTGINHAQQRCVERNGVFIPSEDLKVMSQLIELGNAVHLGGKAYLLRYGKHIFHVIYCAKIKRIKTIYPQDDIAGLMIGTVPREELRKLIETR